MKKILFLLIIIYTYSLSSTYEDAKSYNSIRQCTVNSQVSFENVDPSLCNPPQDISVPFAITSSGFITGSRLQTKMVKSFGKYYCQKRGVATLHTNCQILTTPKTPEQNTLCPDIKAVTRDDAVYVCQEDTGNYDINPLIPNGSYSPDGQKQCDDGYFPTGSSTMENYCMNTPYTPEGDDGSCPAGWTPATSLTTGETVCNPPNYSTGSTGGGDTSTGSTGGGDTSTGSTGGGDTSTGSTDSTVGDTSGGSTGSTIGDTPTGSTGGGGGSVGGGSGDTTPSTGGDSADTATPDSEQAEQSSSYLCQDGGKSLTTPSGMQSCDRTCEQVGLITNTLNDTCYGDKECPEGETRTGWNGMTGEPFCYKLSNDTNLNKSETLLAKIVENTSNNKNSNTQLGSINSKVNVTNAKLEAVKGGLSGINTSITTGNEQLTQINSKLSDSEGNNFIENISNGISAIVTPMGDDKQNEHKTKIKEKLESTLNDTFTKYSNILGFGSTYAPAPKNITVVLFNKTYTLIDFSILDDHVSIIRTLFLSLAYLYGFLFFLRGAK